MSKYKLKILVACHKPADVYGDDVYTPIHVGRALSPYKEEMKYMIGDDTGENISKKNPYYCELTAQYWAWKNLDAEYIGLCHYRRFFNEKYTNENVDEIFQNYDVVLSKQIVCSTNLLTRLIISSSQEDMQLFFAVIRKISPEYYDDSLKYMLSNRLHGYNMFVIRENLFSKFAEWQFSILNELEKYVRLSGYTRGKRIYGYFAEFLLPIFCIHNRLKIKEVPVVSKIGSYKMTLRDFLSKEYQEAAFLFSPQRTLSDSATLVGLKMDFENSDILDYIEK